MASRHFGGMPLTDSASSSFLGDRNTILQVLEQICPLETEVIGPTTLDDILAGADFKQVRGGSHFDLSTTISLVSCICSLTQLGIKAWEMRHTQNDLAELNSGFENNEQRVRVAISDHIAQHPDVGRILSDNAKTPEQVARTIEVVLSSKSARHDEH